MCEITLRVTDDITFTVLQLDVDASRGSGNFVARERNVVCTRPITGVLTRTLVGCSVERPCTPGTSDRLLVSIGGNVPIKAPVEIARCRFAAEAQPEASDFTVTVEDAAGTQLAPIPFPNVEMTRVSCALPGSTSTTTSTTLGCDDASCAAGERRAPCAWHSTSARFQVNCALSLGFWLPSKGRDDVSVRWLRKPCDNASNGTFRPGACLRLM